MDYVLGILTGVALCMAYGHYTIREARKHQIEKERRMMTYFFGKPRDLGQELDDAIAREDFAEAARIRDIMNRK